MIVPPHIRDDLKHHLDTYVGEDPTAQLFPAARGCHLNDRVFRDYLAPALKTIGREDMRIHDLRHFAGTQAARVGNLPETMARLGHSTPKVSSIYQGIARMVAPKKLLRPCRSWPQRRTRGGTPSGTLAEALSRFGSGHDTPLLRRG